MSLTERRLAEPAAVIAGMPPDSRPLPSVTAYDELLARGRPLPGADDPSSDAADAAKSTRVITQAATAALSPCMRRRWGMTEQAAEAAVDQHLLHRVGIVGSRSAAKRLDHGIPAPETGLGVALSAHFLRVPESADAPNVFRSMSAVTLFSSGFLKRVNGYIRGCDGDGRDG